MYILLGELPGQVERVLKFYRSLVFGFLLSSCYIMFLHIVMSILITNTTTTTTTNSNDNGNTNTNNQTNHNNIVNKLVHRRVNPHPARVRSWARAPDARTMYNVLCTV